MVEEIDLHKFFKLATTNKKYANGLNLHQIKSEILLGCMGDLELIGYMLIGEIEQKTNIRFKNIDDFESYINAIENGGYDSENVIFTGWLYIINTPDFTRVNRAQYGKGTYFAQDFVEYIGNNCYTPTGGNCFIKCSNRFTKKNIQKKIFIFFSH